MQDAVKYDEANPEAHQMTAQLRIVEGASPRLAPPAACARSRRRTAPRVAGRREEAKASILRTVELLNALEDAEEELPPYVSTRRARRPPAAR